ncbi:MAG: hypothetical protein ABI411_20055 [Tahibacter sp.]
MTVRILRQPMTGLFSLLFIVSTAPAFAVVGPDYPQACLATLRTAVEAGTFSVTAPEQSIDLPTINGAQGAQGFAIGQRPAIVSVGRFPCGGSQSITVLRIRDSFNLMFPHTMQFPRLTAVQGAAHAELNAVAAGDAGSDAAPAPAIGFDTYAALENQFGEIDFSKAFRLSVSAYPDSAATTFDVPNFAPTPATEPDAFGPRPINGRYAGNYFDPARSGEGIIIEIGDVPGQHGQHFLQFSWFTYDNEGKPFWISGGGNFDDGDKSLHMPAAFRGGGRFAGARAASTLTLWGTVDVAFDDCNTLQLRYQANDGLPANVPAGSGRLEWRRLTGISDYSCN